MHPERLQPRSRSRRREFGGGVQQHELALRQPAPASPQQTRLEHVTLLRARGGLVRGGHEQDGVGVPRTLRAPRRRERIRLEEDDVVRRLELRQPVRRRLASQRTNARLSNLRQPRRAVRHARHARLAQRREHGAAKFVQRQRRTLRDGNHRHRSRRGGRASRVSSARRRRMVRRRRARGSPATVDSSRDVTPRELHPPQAEMVRVHVRSDGVRTRARAPRQRHERAWRRRRQRVQS